MSILRTLPAIKTPSSKRVGRGIGSGQGGHTSTRGQKGQRSKGKIPLWFEGGQLPLIKRLPMLRGKHRLNSLQETVELTATQIAKLNEPIITREVLMKHKLVRTFLAKIKIIASPVHAGQISTPLTLQGVSASKGAREAIEKAGGKVE